MKPFLFLITLTVSSMTFAADTPVRFNPHAGMVKPGMIKPEQELTQQASVLTTINVPKYTYIEVLQDKKTRWLASTTTTVKKGDTIRFDQGMVMTNFYSKRLKRTFPNIAFVENMEVGLAKK